MCKACFGDCHKGHDASYEKMARSAYCDCFTVKCKFLDPNHLRQKKEEEDKQKIREEME